MEGTKHLTPRYSQLALGLADDILGPILADGSKPDFISFGGGLPCPEGFPVEALREASDWCLKTYPSRSLQYSGPEGEPELREQIAAYVTSRGNPTSPDEILVTSGSQQALDLCGRVFCDPGSKILIQRPSYIGALEAFNLSQPTYVEMPSDAEGAAPAEIGEEARGVRFAYTLATYCNPTGQTMSAERRKQLIEKAEQYDFWIVEDDPYGELWYEKKPPISIRNLAPHRTIRLCSFSKILAPGLRLGYIIAPRDVIQMFSKIQSYAVLSTPCINQLVAARVLASGLLKTHLPEVRAIYREHSFDMQQALSEFMPKDPGISWTRPEGGMFIWLTLPKPIDTFAMLPKALRMKLLYVPGFAFYPNSPEQNHIRLSFVTVPKEKTIEGVQRLAALVSDELRRL